MGLRRGYPTHFISQCSCEQLLEGLKPRDPKHVTGRDIRTVQEYHISELIKMVMRCRLEQAVRLIPRYSVARVRAASGDSPHCRLVVQRMPSVLGPHQQLSLIVNFRDQMAFISMPSRPLCISVGSVRSSAHSLRCT
jgi:hypothetical protein